MITVRVVRTDVDIDAYVAVRTLVHPETPMPRDVVVDDRRKPDHLDLIAELDGQPVGVASTAKFGGDPDGDLAFVTIRVVAEHRRHGVGTALHLRASEHARLLEKTTFWVAARDTDADSLGYYRACGYREIGRMQDVYLALAAADVTPEIPAGIEIAAATEEHDRGAYAVALEADADIPAAVPIVSGSFEQWRERSFGTFVDRQLSFVALEAGRVVGYATLGRFTEDTFMHWMTGVARSERGRGVALALKQTQIVAARRAGVAYLRTQNDLGNGSMLRVNEKLGYERRFEWVHLSGPLLGG
ncbi:MAG: GNAT family N-acetyltransferase [Actinobacteria bacterium]|nr:GNAT family N-acetyltransferase [Actinomycetota bacterium]